MRTDRISVREADGLAGDPAVRAAVLATVTIEEAARTLRSKAGKPWCDAFLLQFCDGLSSDPEIAADLGDGVRSTLGLPHDYLRDNTVGGGA